MASSVQGFLSLHIVRAAPDHYILVIFGEDPGALDRLAAQVGSTWMKDNVVPLLGAPPERHVGPLVATSSP